MYPPAQQPIMPNRVLGAQVATRSYRSAPTLAVLGAQPFAPLLQCLPHLLDISMAIIQLYTPATLAKKLENCMRARRDVAPRHERCRSCLLFLHRALLTVGYCTDVSLTADAHAHLSLSVRWL